MTIKHTFFAGCAGLAIICGIASQVQARDYGAVKPSLGGFVVGPTGGFTWGEAEFSDPLVPGVEITDDLEGWDGGALVGYEFTNGALFTGFEFMGALGGPEKSHLGGGVKLDYGVDGHVDFRIRAGTLLNNRVAAYGIGGATYARLTSEISDGVTSLKGEEWRWGWLAGAGLEFLLTPNLSVAAEYTYTDLEERTYAGLVTIDGDFHAVRAAGRVRY